LATKSNTCFYRYFNELISAQILLNMLPRLQRLEISQDQQEGKMITQVIHTVAFALMSIAVLGTATVIVWAA